GLLADRAEHRAKLLDRLALARVVGLERARLGRLVRELEARALEDEERVRASGLARADDTVQPGVARASLAVARRLLGRVRVLRERALDLEPSIELDAHGDLVALFLLGALGLGVGELVHALVLDVAGVAADPLPLDLVRRRGALEPLPEVAVEDVLLARVFPAPLLPAGEPLGHALDDVLRVGVDDDL